MLKTIKLLHRINQNSFKFIFISEFWNKIFLSQLTGGVIVVAMALVLLAAVTYQCAATWRWVRSIISRKNSQTPESSNTITKQASIRISHSLPNLQTVPAKSEFVQEKECKKVLRQTTLPTVPARHLTFQRRLSHRFDVPCIQFSICKFEEKSDLNLGLIKVSETFIYGIFIEYLIL